MHRFTLTLEPRRGPLHGRTVTARGLHGMFFKGLKEADPAEATWLHDHPAPKPYSMSALYSPGGLLLGLRLGAVSDRAAALIERCWTWHRDQGNTFQLGPNICAVSEVEYEAGPRWLELAQTPPVGKLTLRFLSPTAFRQGPGHLPLPLPQNVFHGPLRVWQVFSPLPTLADDWLEWCSRDVFVVDHDIETARVAISRDECFVGFVGDVTFEPIRQDANRLSLMHVLGRLAEYCGVGHKTAMGMGAVMIRHEGKS